LPPGCDCPIYTFFAIEAMPALDPRLISIHYKPTEAGASEGVNRVLKLRLPEPNPIRLWNRAAGRDKIAEASSRLAGNPLE
jgi:hypothetical protein